MKYNPPLGGGANDPYVDGNQGTGVEGTTVPAAAIEFPQREIEAVIAAAAGIVPTNGDLTQLLEAIKQLTGGNYNAVNATGALVASKAGLIVVDATAGNIVITLPAANVQQMLRYRFVRIDGTANTVTVNAAGADHIDQATNFTLVGQNASRSVEADGVSVWRSSSISGSTVNGSGRCELKFVSGVQMLLMPGAGGNSIRLNGKTYSLPAGGVANANTVTRVSGVAGQNLAASTVYLDYLMDDGTGNLVHDNWPVAGGHMTDTTPGNIGVEVRSNGGVPDSTRSLVGIFQTNGAGQFQGGLLFRSWFKRSAAGGSANASGSTTSNAAIEIGTTFRVPFVCFADDLLVTSSQGYSGLNNNSETDAWMAIDGATVAPALKTNYGGPLTSFVGATYTALWTGSLADGLHTATLFGNAGVGGTASFAGTTQVAMAR